LVAKLIKFLDELIAELKNDLEEIETNEAKSITAFIQIQNSIERENYVLKHSITGWKKYVEEVQKTIDTNTQSHS